MMKTNIIIAILAALVLPPVAGRAQSAAEFKEKYERQVRNAGADGVGVEYILDSWAAAYPDDAEMYKGRFLYHFAKGRSSRVEERASKSFLGQEPMLTLKDQNGNPVYYYDVPVYDEEYFGQAIKDIEVAIKLAPDEIGYRFDKISALIGYEGGSPDMSSAELISLMEYNFTKHPHWTYAGEPFSETDFSQSMQEYCFTLFRMDTPAALEHFRNLSARMSRYEPRNADWVSNEGAYWQKAEKNYKKALKCYNKALKMDPDNYAAKQNISIINRLQKLGDKNNNKQ